VKCKGKVNIKGENMKKLLVAAVILFGLGTAANAMDLNGKLEVGVGSFYGIPTSSDFNDVVDNAFAWTLFADYKVLNNVSVGLEYAQSFGYDISENGDGPDSIDENYFGIRGKYLLPFDIGNMKANAYGLVGIARYKWETDPDYVDDDGIGFSLGLGMNVDLTENIFAGAEARYHFAPKFDVGGEEGSFDMNHMGVGIQAGYRF